MHKSKPIAKEQKSKDRKKQSKKPITDDKGDPLIKNLSDFVTSIKIKQSSKPIYTGGPIIAMDKNLYSLCNQQIVIYSFEQGTIIDRIKHLNQQIVNFGIDPQQKYIVTFTQNSMARVLLIESRKVINTTRMNNHFANDIQFCPDGRHLAFAFGNTVHIFTFETMKRTHTYNPTNSKFAINKLQWHPSPQKLQIITCDMQRNIAVFDYILNKVIAVSESGAGGTSFCLAANGDLIVAVNNQELKVFETATMKVKSSLQVQQYFQTLFAVDGQVFTGGDETELYSFSINNINKIKLIPGCTDNGIAKIMSTGKQAHRKLLVLSSQQNLSVFKFNNNGLSFQGMIVGYNDQIIDIKNSKPVDKDDTQSPYFVMVTNSNNIKVMNKLTHRMEYLIKGHTNTVLCVDYWHPFVASAGKDNIVKLWKIHDQEKRIQLVANYNGHSADVLSIVALTQKKMIASVSQDYTIKLWPMCTESNQKIQIKSAIRTTIAHQKSINAIRASPNQQLLVTCSQDKTLKLWNEHLTNVMTLVGHKRGVWDAAFHPVQQLLVSAGGDGMLKGWNLQTGECVWSMGEGAALIRCCWIYYNQVVTGSLSGIVKIWDIRKQTSLSYDKHQGKIWALDVTKNNGKAEIMSGANDSVYHVWVDNTQEMKENIMHEHQLQEQQRIFYDQHIANKQYCQAAFVAFKAGYTKLFMKVLQKISCKINPQQGVTTNQQDKLMIAQTDQQILEVSNQKFDQMVAQLKTVDLPRLLINIQAMTSTVKLYKMANKLLLSVLKSSSFSQLSQLNSSFALADQPENMDQFNQKKSGLVKWLQNMIGYEQKHLTRLNKYNLGTHWIQHLHRRANPYSA